MFEIFPTGDPYNRTGWDVREYEKSYDDRFCIFRGDISPVQGKRNTILLLRRMHPGCEIKVSDH